MEFVSLNPYSGKPKPKTEKGLQPIQFIACNPWSKAQGTGQFLKQINPITVET